MKGANPVSNSRLNIRTTTAATDIISRCIHLVTIQPTCTRHCSNNHHGRFYLLTRDAIADSQSIVGRDMMDAHA